MVYRNKKKIKHFYIPIPDLDKLTDLQFTILQFITHTLTAGLLANNFLTFIINVFTIPVFLTLRALLNKPIHANGLTPCYFLTSTYFILTFIFSHVLSLRYHTIIHIIILYLFITLSTMMLSASKLFLGIPKSKGKYSDVFTLIQSNSIPPLFISYLQLHEPILYIIYLHLFKLDKTWDEVMELTNIWERKTFDREVYALAKLIRYSVTDTPSS